MPPAHEHSSQERDFNSLRQEQEEDAAFDAMSVKEALKLIRKLVVNVLVKFDEFKDSSDKYKEEVKLLLHGDGDEKPGLVGKVREQQATVGNLRSIVYGAVALILVSFITGLTVWMIHPPK